MDASYTQVPLIVPDKRTGRPPRPMEERFWEKVIRSDGCWTWNSAKNERGYGVFRHRGKNIVAHRLMWTLTYGVIPDGMKVCHHCDNPCCVNPAHLFLGTHKDNMKDMVAKGRSTRGEAHPRHRHPELFVHGELSPFAKLTEEQVREINRLFHDGGHSSKALARQFGVNKSHIWRIVSGNTWKHLDRLREAENTPQDDVTNGA